MARVYEAEDVRLGRRVAVKVLLPQFTHDPEFLRRFEQEARLAASLSHPNVVGVYDVGQDGEFHYIVMELVDGQTLKDAIAAARPMPVPEALRIAIEVCAALSAAHARGMVHRDIKPQNILLTADRQVKVADFGIARRGAATAVTQTGTVLGSVHYLSPEQARGQDAGPRSDLYALGITLFEMLTGRLPFNAENPIAVAMQQVQNAPPLPRQFNRAIPPALEAIILRLLAKNPNERFPDAASVIAALRGVLGQAGGATRVAAPAAGPQPQHGAPPPTRVMPPTGPARGVPPPTGFAAPAPVQQVQATAPVVTRKQSSGRRAVLAGIVVGGVMALLVVLVLAILSTGGALPGLTGSASATPIPTSTPTVTPRPTHTPRPIVVAPVATHTSTATPRPTHTRVPTATGTPFPTVTESASFTPTSTPVPPTQTATETPLPTLTPTGTPSPSPSPTDTATPAPSATETRVPSDTPTAPPSATSTETPSATRVPDTETPTDTGTPLRTDTPTPTGTPVASTSTPFIVPYTDTPTPALPSDAAVTPPADVGTPPAAAGTPRAESSPASTPLFNAPTPVPTPTFLG